MCFFRRLLVLVLVFQLSGCGFLQNVSKLFRSNAFVYSLGEPYVDKSNPETTNILVKIVDLGCFTKKQKEKVKAELKDTIKDIGYKVVESIDEANMVITIIFKNFSQISESSIQGIEKYMHYKEATGSIITSGDKIAPNDVKLAMSGDGVSVSGASGGTAYNPTTGFFTKLFQSDFSSGIALGLLSSFLIAGANPITLVLGAMVGGVITALLQTIFTVKNYSGSVSVKISKKEGTHVSKKKILSFESTNIIKESHIESVDNWTDYTSNLLIVVNSPLTAGRGRKMFMKSSIKAVESLLGN